MHSTLLILGYVVGGFATLWLAMDLIRYLEFRFPSTRSRFLPKVDINVQVSATDGDGEPIAAKTIINVAGVAQKTS